MRVLHIATRHRVGGAERNLANFVREEIRLNHEVHVALGRESDSNGFQGVEIHPVRELVREIDLVRDVRAIFRLRGIIRSAKFDVVHTHQSKAGVLGRIAAIGTGTFVVHSVHMPSFGPGYGRVRSLLFLTAERVCARFTHRFICVGDEIRELYVSSRVVQQDRCTTLRSPIDVDGLIALRGDVARQRRARSSLCGSLEGRAVVGVIGALDVRKRVGLVIESLGPGLRDGTLALLVAGAGPERAALEAAAEGREVGDAVKFLGHCREVEDVFAAIDVLVHASLVEGVPQVVLQALAAGKRVVATEAEGLREVFWPGLSIIDRTGSRLLPAVQEALRHPVPPIDADALTPWRPTVVCAAIDTWVSEVALLLEGEAPAVVARATA